MASIQKAEVKVELKAEPKEQRELKKVSVEKPLSVKSSTNLDKKESKETNSPKKEVQPLNKPSEQPKQSSDQKTPDKKDTKELNAVRKEVQAINKLSEQNKLPADLKNQEKADIKKDSAAEKKDAALTNKIVSNKGFDMKPSSPDKTDTKKPSVEKPTNGDAATSIKSLSSTSVTVNQNNQEKPKTNNGTSNSKDAKNQDKVSNNGNGLLAVKEKKDKTPKDTNGSSESKKQSQNNSSMKLPEKNETSKLSAPSEKSQSTSSLEITDNISSQSTTDMKLLESGEKTEQISDKNNNKNDETSKTEDEQTKKEEKTLTTKFQLRSEMWNKMFRSSALAFRKPCNYRIPHFKGDMISAGRLTTMELFQNSKVVKVSLDKAHESVRLQIIEAGKEMIVGCPGLREAVFLHVKPPMEPSKSSNKLASSRIGIGHVGAALDFSSATKADLVIVGSVAVDKTGLRVGKGEGFADLEYALLKKLGGIAPNAPIITVVHDSQVYDTLPEELFKEHDVPADYIVTPTQVIEINPKRNHPDLIWNILSNRRVNSIPIIKQLLDREKNRDGADISLKDEDTDTEDLEQIARRKRYFMRRRTYSNGSQRGRRSSINRNDMVNMRGGRTRRHTAPSERGYQAQMMPGSPRPTRTFRNRIPSFSRNNYPNDLKQNDYWRARNFQNGGRRRMHFRQMFRPKYSVDFSLKVQGLTNGIRVRDLKQAVTERGIRPRDISWLPHKGMAFLHFSKPKQLVEEAPLPPDTDAVLASLKDLTVKCENGPETNLKVEPAQPFRKVHFTV